MLYVHDRAFPGLPPHRSPAWLIDRRSRADRGPDWKNCPNFGFLTSLGALSRCHVKSASGLRLTDFKPPRRPRATWSSPLAGRQPVARSSRVDRLEPRAGRANAGGRGRRWRPRSVEDSGICFTCAGHRRSERPTREWRRQRRAVMQLKLASSTHPILPRAPLQQRRWRRPGSSSTKPCKSRRSRSSRVSSPGCQPSRRGREAMNERAKITASHLSRQAIVYLRQSSAAQVENNRELTDRQYALAAKARELGWPADRIVVIDEDLGLSGSGFVARSGFARQATKQAAPNAATAPSIPTTGWSRGASSANGRSRRARSRPPRSSFPAAKRRVQGALPG